MSEELDGKSIVKAYLTRIRNQWRREAGQTRGQLDLEHELNKRADALTREINKLNAEWPEFLENLKDAEESRHNLS